MKEVCPVIQLVTKPKTYTTKEEILARINELEIKADVYSEIDYTRYNEIAEEIRNLDMKLLDIYSKENETFLQTHPSA